MTNSQNERLISWLSSPLTDEKKLNALAQQWLTKPVVVSTRARAEHALRMVEVSCAMAESISEDDALEVLFLRDFIAAIDRLSNYRRGISMHKK